MDSEYEIAFLRYQKTIELMAKNPLQYFKEVYDSIKVRAKAEYQLESLADEKFSCHGLFKGIDNMGVLYVAVATPYGNLIFANDSNTTPFFKIYSPKGTQFYLNENPNSALTDMLGLDAEIDALTFLGNHAYL